jgi:hypothetical protein
MLTALDIQQRVKAVAIDAMNILYAGLDKAIGDYMTGQSDNIALAPEQLVWYTRFLAVHLAEYEMVGKFAEAKGEADKIVHMFRIIDSASGFAQSQGTKEIYEMMQNVKDDIIDFLSSRPTVPAIDQTYGGTIPKNVIELNASIR